MRYQAAAGLALVEVQDCGRDVIHRESCCVAEDEHLDDHGDYKAKHRPAVALEFEKLFYQHHRQAFEHGSNPDACERPALRAR